MDYKSYLAHNSINMWAINCFDYLIRKNSTFINSLLIPLPEKIESSND